MRTATLILLAGLCLGGCVARENDSPAFSDGTVMESMRPLPTERTYMEPDHPSISALDRSNWPATEFSASQRNVVYQPQYASKPVQRAHSSAVQRGEYPTPETAGENITGNSRRDQALEGVLLPLQALGDVVLLIPRAIITPINTPVHGPFTPVERVPPHPVAVSSVAQPPVPDAEPATSPPSPPPPSTPSNPSPATPEAPK